jgi:cobalt/nickel transport system permease protein
MPDYAPAFMHDANFGYILSAVIGAGLILIVFSALSWVFGRRMRSAPVRA